MASSRRRLQRRPLRMRLGPGSGCGGLAMMRLKVARPMPSPGRTGKRVLRDRVALRAAAGRRPSRSWPDLRPGRKAGSGTCGAAAARCWPRRGRGPAGGGRDTARPGKSRRSSPSPWPRPPCRGPPTPSGAAPPHLSGAGWPAPRARPAGPPPARRVPGWPPPGRGWPRCAAGYPAVPCAAAAAVRWPGSSGRSRTARAVAGQQVLGSAAATRSAKVSAAMSRAASAPTRRAA